MASPPSMKAVVIRRPGSPDVLEIEELAIPVPRCGEVLIRVKAFGINRSELFTRQGLSPGVKFPRVLGIEAVGLVAQAPGSEFREGDIVATAMGGMGSDFGRGIVCMTGMVGNNWSLEHFSPMEIIPTAVCLTTYDGGAEDFMLTPLEELVEEITAGQLPIQVGKVFKLDQIVDAHRCMEENKAGGKVVVLT